MKVIFADETVFTKNTLLTKSYALKGENIEIDEKAIETKYRSALAGISTDGIVEHLKVTEGAINAKKYMQFLAALRKKIGKERFCLFVDNLRVHKTSDVMKTYHLLNIEPIFNAPYNPDGNPIETAFV